MMNNNEFDNNVYNNNGTGNNTENGAFPSASARNGEEARTEHSFEGQPAANPDVRANAPQNPQGETYGAPFVKPESTTTFGNGYGSPSMQGNGNAYANNQGNYANPSYANNQGQGVNRVYGNISTAQNPSGQQEEGRGGYSAAPQSTPSYPYGVNGNTSAPNYASAAGERTYFGNGSTANSAYDANSVYIASSSGAYGNGNYGTSSSIRYDADKTAGDGSYTWNYANGNENTSSNKETSKRKTSKNGVKVFIATAIAFVIVGAVSVSAIMMSALVKNPNMFDGKNKDAVTEEKPLIGSNNNGTHAENMVTIPSENNGILTKQQIAYKCKPSSVGIQTVVTAQAFYGLTYKTGGVGSGFILTEDGYIATNHHVIEGADSITVQLDDGTKHQAKLIGSDSVTDLAVLKIEATGLVPMEIGNSDEMVVGDSVIAIGTPAGIEFAGTVTDGIISAINRGIEITNDRGTVVKTMTLMQTNAAINPGNSGGPLINDKGQVIGINTLKLTSTYEGIGFSIPINSAVKIFNQLINDGKVTEYDSGFVTGNGAIGITEYAEISEREAEYYDVPRGIIVVKIQNTSSAVAAGLRRGDIIVAFNGERVHTVDELNKLKSKFKAGDEVTLRIYRDGDGEKDITFKLDIMQ